MNKPAVGCPECRTPMTSCWSENEHTGKLVLKHWYCCNCTHDERAIGRERMFDFERVDTGEVPSQALQRAQDILSKVDESRPKSSTG